MENHTCGWIVSQNPRFKACNCQSLATQKISGKWWCDFHARAIALHPSVVDGIILGRVSSREQADRGYSLQVQVDDSVRYAIANHIRVLPEHVFVEDISGTVPIVERPGGRKAIDLISRGVVRAIIAHKVDRYSRDIVDLLANVRNWIRAGVAVHATDIGHVKSELDIVLVIKAWQGGDERIKINGRMSDGRNQKARQGKVVGGRLAPYGYSFIRDAKNKVVGLEILDSEAEIVTLIFKWYILWDETGKPLTFWGIAKKLTDMQIPTPHESRNCSIGGRGPNRSGVWNISTIHKIVSNETYAGVWRYGSRKGRNGRDGHRPLTEQISVSVPHIIDREMWEEAQARRSFNREMAKRNGKRDYLLRGMVYCSCGNKMSGLCPNRSDRYYRCNRMTQIYASGSCKRLINAKRIEEWVWSEIAKLFENKEYFERALRKAQERELDAFAPKRSEYETVEQMIRDSEKEAQECAIALRKAGSGLVRKALEDQVALVDARYDALMKRRTELQAELGAQRLSDEAIADLLQFREDVIVGMKSPTSEDKRQILERLGVKVRLETDHFTIETVIKSSILSDYTRKCVRDTRK